MARRDQVLSLFGASPQQIMAQQAREQAQMVQQISNPYQQVGTAIGVGLGRLFGGESPEVEQSRMLEEALQGVDPTDPEALRNVAKTVSAFAPERALQIATYAGELERSSMGQIINVPEIVGYETEPDINPLTGLQRTDENGKPMFVRTPVWRNVPYERTPQGSRRIEGLPDYGAQTQPSGQPAPNANGSQAGRVEPDFIVDPETNQLVPNPAKSSQAPTQTPFEVQTDPRITPEAQAAMEGATGPRGGGSMGSITAVPPPPALQAETTFVNPDVLQEEIDVLQAQLKGLPANSPQRKALQRQINQRRALKSQFTKGTTRTRRGR